MARSSAKAARRVIGAVAIARLLLGCAAPDGCLGGDDGACVPQSACDGLSYACQSRALVLKRVDSPDDRPRGHAALAAIGDVLLGNDQFVAVLDAPDSPHHMAPSGGGVLDFVPLDGASGDELDQVFQAVGILPDDAARYESVELLDESPSSVSAIFRGHLDGRPSIDVVTRYEARPCEPGLRVRTEIYHGGRDPLSMLASDAYFWGDRGPLPFAPRVGGGFRHPSLDLEKLSDGIVDAPFMTAPSFTEDAAAYGAVACEDNALSGFLDRTLTALGSGPFILMPGDSTALDRMLLVAPGPGMQRVASAASEIRGQLFEERFVDVSGRVTTTSGGAPDPRQVGLLFYEPAAGSDPDAVGGRRPWAQATPDDDGRFVVRLPARRHLRIETQLNGRPLLEHAELATSDSDASIPDVVVDEPGRIEVTVVDAGGKPLVAELVLIPSSPTAASEVSGSEYGEFRYARCAPYLGPPHGGSPACNRVLVGPSGTVTFNAPSGHFRLFATHGPFWSLAEKRIEVQAGKTVSAELALAPLDVLPEGVLSADFHVHSGASFDSNLPQRDRALSFVAAGVDVAVATDHDVVTSYEAALLDLGLADRVKVIPGVETTGEILFLKPPGADIPKVVGHFNFWPLGYDASLPRNGAPDDERLEPAELFDRVEPLYTGKGVAQLNHPFADDDLGRDTGYFTAVGWDPRRRIPDHDDGTPGGQLARKPSGGRSNLSYDAQEVMNGYSLEGFLRYRTAWHSLLGQGLVRAGTANSDSHSLTAEALGYPRNLVLGGHSLSAFDLERFDDDVRNGRMVGTNGPVLVVCVEALDGSCAGPSLTGFSPKVGAKVRVQVRAAPWIPVEEIRFVVNGRVAKKLPKSALTQPSGREGPPLIIRFDGEIPLADLLAGWSGGDAWLVVEAGLPLPPFECSEDGLPELTDTDPDQRLPFDDPRFFVQVVAPGTWPTAFTNPFLLDLDDVKSWQPPQSDACCDRASCEAPGL